MRPLLILFFSLLLFINADAQRLPGIQKGGMYAPDNIKIDGKPTEWAEFKAFNKATFVYYTIANDDKRLYIALHATDGKIITKILNGGVSFSVSEKKKLDNRSEVLNIFYPIFEDGYKPSLLKADNGDKAASSTSDFHRIADSIATLNNLRILSKLKSLSISRSGKKDTLSIYNDEGIRTASGIDNKQAYTYELAIDLDKIVPHLKGQKFYYNIKLNGLKNIPGVVFETAADGSQAMVVTDAKIASGFSASLAPTDFWGEYELITNK